MNRNLEIFYIGPSWAVRSFDTVEGSEENYTNLLKEWNIDARNLSKLGLSNENCLGIIRRQSLDNCKGIIWVYCEPILQVEHEFKQALIEDEDFWAAREKINQQTFKWMNELNIPIGLIGGHSDIVHCNQPNIEVIHPSWQKFLADEVGVDLEHGWGAEIAHRYATYEFPGTTPSWACVDLICDTFTSWTKMELTGMFRGCHPTKKGNELFAKEIKSNIDNFIKNL